MRTLDGLSWLPKHCMIIAEAGVNHNGDIDLGRRLIDAAADAGADAVKFQSFKATEVATASAPKANYQVAGSPEDASQLEMLRRLELSEEDHRILVQHCADRGILFMSTPFDRSSADLLADIGVPVVKMSSGELTNLPFQRYVAAKGIPMLISTGMSNLGEVDEAVRAVQETGNQQIALLHCVSNYPAAAKDVNLRAMETMRVAFGLPVGYSDHTLGNEVSLAAVAMGACVLEKHFTLDRHLPGPDHQASLEPAEIAALVASVRIVEEALGNGRKVPAASEANTAMVARRSIVATRDLSAGTVLTADDLNLKRPGTGLPSTFIDRLIGARLGKAVAADEQITFDAFQA